MPGADARGHGLCLLKWHRRRQRHTGPSLAAQSTTQIILAQTVGGVPGAGADGKKERDEVGARGRERAEQRRVQSRTESFHDGWERSVEDDSLFSFSFFPVFAFPPSFFWLPGAGGFVFLCRLWRDDSDEEDEGDGCVGDALRGGGGGVLERNRLHVAGEPAGRRLCGWLPRDDLGRVCLTFAPADEVLGQLGAECAAKRGALKRPNDDAAASSPAADAADSVGASSPVPPSMPPPLTSASTGVPPAISNPFPPSPLPSDPSEPPKPSALVLATYTPRTSVTTSTAAAAGAASSSPEGRPPSSASSANDRQMSAPESVLSAGAKAAIAISVSLASVSIVAAALFFGWRRRRQADRNSGLAEDAVAWLGHKADEHPSSPATAAPGPTREIDSSTSGSHAREDGHDGPGLGSFPWRLDLPGHVTEPSRDGEMHAVGIAFSTDMYGLLDSWKLPAEESLEPQLPHAGWDSSATPRGGSSAPGEEAGECASAARACSGEIENTSLGATRASPPLSRVARLASLTAMILTLRSAKPTFPNWQAASRVPRAAAPLPRKLRISNDPPPTVEDSKTPPDLSLFLGVGSDFWHSLQLPSFFACASQMQYEKHPPPSQAVKAQPRIVIHGGAGNIARANFPSDKYSAYRDALLTIWSATQKPSALDVACYAVALLEDNALFNSGHGAVFTRDGTNELEASVMVSRGRKKRGVGVAGLRHVRNPVLLARAMLVHGDEDVAPRGAAGTGTGTGAAEDRPRLDVPSAQGHTQIWGLAAEQLARRYGLDMVDPRYFFTQQRWDEHLGALDRERRGLGCGTWSAEEYLPQGTCGAVALDEDGVVCAATSTGGLTNKLTGRIGDTPVVGAGFWAEEWEEELAGALGTAPPGLSLAGPLKGLLADCLPTPFFYPPPGPDAWSRSAPHVADTVASRAVGVSGTGNGDSFLRTSAARTVAAMARWKPESTASALTNVVGPGGELQRSAGDRWGHTGEGEGGMIGIECVVERDAKSGQLVRVRSEIMMDYNCGGMFRAWVDDEGTARMSIWSNAAEDPDPESRP
ncbi:L-asparaginase precursor [Metarhizium album ARSEF 1941]|uniref:L-asparaginase n=1 Tax=Metarhizium album (strain ARSEF 1941) TaxID=1081103 RepID=A0A0B2WR31_METAS|nr:L-asparaginase precursor [Metarhizium album ARSEF 1941]KHN95952.1 L-asparaginase precursor [Metarhizium album ARSEF 1941]